MERKQKIELLKGIANGSRDLKELAVIHDPFIIDESDHRPIIEAIKINGSNIIYAKDFERLEQFITGFVCDLRNGSMVLSQISN